MEIISMITGFLITTFIYAYCWHMIVFKNAYRDIGIYNREKPIIVIGFLTTITQGAIFSILFKYFNIDLPDIFKGILLGLLLGLFEFCSSALAFGAKRKIEKFGKWVILQLMLSITIFPVSGTVAVFVSSIFS